jgi:hypothetical protein
VVADHATDIVMFDETGRGIVVQQHHSFPSQ